jgi:hypothetical protein
MGRTGKQLEVLKDKGSKVETEDLKVEALVEMEGVFWAV